MNPHRIAAACAQMLALSAVLAAPSAHAQDLPPGVGEPQPRPAGTKLERVEISSRSLGDTDLRRKSPVAKQIYGREEMDKYGDTNLADVLKRLPGVDLQGGSPRMRGLGAGYTLILINGDPAPPGFALDQLNPAQVERIEITKGPTADQSAQAVAGAINIILKEAPRVSQRDLRVGVGYSAQRPTPSATFTYGERIGALALSLPVSMFEWRGESTATSERRMPGADGAPSQAIQRQTQPNWGHGFNTTPRLNWKLSDDENLSLQGFAQRGNWNNRQFYVNEQSTPNAQLEDDAYSHGFWQMLRGNLQWTRRFNDSQRVELKGGLQDSKSRFDTQTYRQGADQRHSVGNNHDQSLTQAGKFSQLLGDEHSLTMGWDLEWRRRDEDRTTTELGKPQLPEFDGQPFGARIERQALFVQDEWELSSQWSTYLGLRTERIATESRGSGDGARNVSRVITPLWHLNYKLDAKGRDLIRASLTRSYKAPELNALLARPSLSSLFPDASQANTELSPDRVGNPLLKPELATGLDIALETYLAGGGMISIGGFYRDVTDLIRNVTTLEQPAWSTVPRYVSRPVNFSKAHSMGLEFEVKGRAGELMPALFDAKLPLNLRGSFNVYHSKVAALSGPNNRLDSQQPWSANLGFDYRMSSLPVNFGASLAYTPGYETQQTASQDLLQSRSRSLDAFAQWTLSRQSSLRFSAGNLLPLPTSSRALLASGYGSRSERLGRTWFGVQYETKL
ncbi:TonB-dependent receptor [Paucibacter sp. APW11]|uniref:TonB-dependent receptor n=1 Tax=Roseateles aquae TaxID=3077235 RepID=A0ABU3P7M9_9BURK|nr:TonB-dependent receptor [Paucibacter sp. APW11]MDT8998581.1 TonB-dependent receptor [Paucibacter sp. APW11]